MSEGGRAGREISNCVEWSIEEFDVEGGFTSTTICIETCSSNAGSNRRSSRKSTSTKRRRRRKKLQEQMWLANAEEDFFQPLPTARPSSSGGKARCAVKTPFAAGTAGAPYNKKLRKKNMQQQQRHHHFVLGAPKATVTAVGGGGGEASSSFFISPTHRAVAEASRSSAGRCELFGRGAHSTNAPRSAPQRRRHGDDDDSATVSVNTLSLDLALVGGGSRVLAPLRSPSILPPVHLLPASKAEISGGVLEESFLEACLDDDDVFSLL